MIGISADFDPVHKGHASLIGKAREIADEKGDEVVIYLIKVTVPIMPLFLSVLRPVVGWLWKQGQIG